VLLALSAASFLQILTNSEATIPSTDNASVNLAIPAQGDPTGVDAEILGEPYHFDHSVVNKQNLPDESNPAPMAIAAYN
jgi:hypothetical protein